MKKIIYMALAVAAFSFASCGNKQAADAPEVDSAAVEAVAESEDAQPVIDALAQSIEAKDAEGIAKILDQVKAQVAKLDPAQASEYIKKVQDYINENKDKIQAFAAGNATVNQLVSTITAINPDEIANGVINAAKGQVEDAANKAVEAGKEAIDAKKEEAKEAVKAEVNKKVDAAKEKANEAINNAANKLLGK